MEVRNNLTHLDSEVSAVDGSDLYYLSESVYSLLRICMLLEIGVAESKIVENSASYELTWYRERLNGAIRRARITRAITSADS